MTNAPRCIYEVVEGIRNPITGFFYHNFYGMVLNVILQVLSMAVGYCVIVRTKTTQRRPIYLFTGVTIGTAAFMAYDLTYWDHFGDIMIPMFNDFGALSLMAIPCIAVSTVPGIKQPYRIVLFVIYILGSLNYVFCFLLSRVFPINALVNWG